MPTYDLTGPRTGIRRPLTSDCDEFLAMILSSRELHRPWVDPPATREAYYTYCRLRQGPADDAFLICDLSTGHLAGVVNLNCIVRGLFHSAYLGYYAAAGSARRGMMTEGLSLVVRYAFSEMGLHRLEANIQPGNAASIALARRCGFNMEGFSPRYLKIAGEWRDHQRWAILADQGGSHFEAGV